MAVLRDLLAIAESAEGLTGFVFVGKFAHGHQGGVAGDYREHPEQAIKAALQLQTNLLNAIRDSD